MIKKILQYTLLLKNYARSIVTEPADFYPFSVRIIKLYKHYINIYLTFFSTNLLVVVSKYMFTFNLRVLLKLAIPASKGTLELVANESPIFYLKLTSFPSKLKLTWKLYIHM